MKYHFLFDDILHNILYHNLGIPRSIHFELDLMRIQIFIGTNTFIPFDYLTHIDLLQTEMCSRRSLVYMFD